MFENYHKAEGIVLGAFPFKEYDKIVTLFTKEKGILKLYVKGSKTTAWQTNALTAPFTVGEYFFYEGKGELFRFSEGIILDLNLSLRNKFETLATSNALLNCILKSQWPEKPSQPLYELLLLFLRKIPEAKMPDTFFASFLLKLLKHEGVLLIPPCEEQKTLHLLAETRSINELLSLQISNAILKKVETLFENSL